MRVFVFSYGGSAARAGELVAFEVLFKKELFWVVPRAKRQLSVTRVNDVDIHEHYN